MYLDPFAPGDDSDRFQWQKPTHLIAVVVRNDIAKHDERLAETIRVLVETAKHEVRNVHNNFKFNRIRRKLEYCEVSPTLRVAERYGRTVERAIRKLAELQSREEDLLDVLFFDIDGSGRKVVRAWYCRKMEVVAFASDDIGMASYSEPHSVECQIAFTCRAYRADERPEAFGDEMRGKTVLEFAQAELERLIGLSTNPFFRSCTIRN